MKFKVLKKKFCNIKVICVSIGVIVQFILNVSLGYWQFATVDYQVVKYLPENSTVVETYLVKKKANASAIDFDECTNLKTEDELDFYMSIYRKGQFKRVIAVLNFWAYFFVIMGYSVFQIVQNIRKLKAPTKDETNVDDRENGKDAKTPNEEDEPAKKEKKPFFKYTNAYIDRLCDDVSFMKILLYPVLLYFYVTTDFLYQIVKRPNILVQFFFSGGLYIVNSSDFSKPCYIGPESPFRIYVAIFSSFNYVFMIVIFSIIVKCSGQMKVKTFLIMMSLFQTSFMYQVVVFFIAFTGSIISTINSVLTIAFGALAFMHCNCCNR